MRVLAIILALIAVAPAAAQAPDAAALATVSRLLSANWRPMPTTTASDLRPTFLGACAGAQEELASFDASLPEELTANALRLARAPHGFIIVSSGDNPAEAYLFPNPTLDFIASGLGTITFVSAEDGRVTIRDVQGRDVRLQLGSLSGQAMMRVLRGDAAPLLFVGCAASVG